MPKKPPKRGPGRPKKNPEERRDKVLDGVRFSDLDLERIRERAAAAGRTVTEWVRARLLGRG